MDFGKGEPDTDLIVLVSTDPTSVAPEFHPTHQPPPTHGMGVRIDLDPIQRGGRGIGSEF